MSKFSDYFNSLKNGETVENKISVSEIIQHISQRWRLSIPKTNAEKQQNPTFIAIANNLTKMVIPFDFETKSQAIVAYGRYRGIIICIAHHKTFTNDKLRILAFIPNKLMGSAKISKLDKPDETIEDTNSLIYRYSIETTYLEDRPLLFRYIDSYSQQMFLTLADNLALDDAFYFNKNMIIFDVTKDLAEEEINVLMSIMLNFMEFVKK